MVYSGINSPYLTTFIWIASLYAPFTVARDLKRLYVYKYFLPKTWSAYQHYTDDDNDHFTLLLP